MDFGFSFLAQQFVKDFMTAFLVLTWLGIAKSLTNKQTTINAQTTSANGAFVSHNSQSVSVSGTNYEVNVQSQDAYDLKISLDETWRFMPSSSSTITVTLDGWTISDNDADILIVFSVADIQYFSFFVHLDDNAIKSRIYSSMAGNIQNVSEWISDIYTIPNRWNRVSNDDKWVIVHDWNKQCVWPLKFVITNHPQTNQSLFELYHDSPASFATDYMFDSSFFGNKEIDIYLMGDSINEQFAVSSLDIRTNHSLQPTTNPTSIPTKYPSASPTTHPVTLGPTHVPTTEPSAIPTLQPSQVPPETVLQSTNNNVNMTPIVSTDVTKTLLVTYSQTVFTTNQTLSVVPNDYAPNYYQEYIFVFLIIAILPILFVLVRCFCWLSKRKGFEAPHEKDDKNDADHLEIEHVVHQNHIYDPKLQCDDVESNLRLHRRVTSTEQDDQYIFDDMNGRRNCLPSLREPVAVGGFEESSEGDLSLYEHTEQISQNNNFQPTMQHPIPEWRPIYHTVTESEVTMDDSLKSFVPIHRNTMNAYFGGNDTETHSDMPMNVNALCPKYVDQSYIKNMCIYINAGRDRKYTATSAASSSSVSETYASDSQLTSPSTSSSSQRLSASTQTFEFTDHNGTPCAI